MAVGTIVGALAVVSAPQASADPVGPMATAEFGVAFRDQGNNGQCGSNVPSPHWVPEGQWTEPVAIDADSRPGACEMQFGLNNVDGSLTGLDFRYSFLPTNNGQCQGTASNASIPFFPFPGSFRGFFMSPIIINTDNRPGGCELTFAFVGRNDVALDVRWETTVPDNGQCPGADPLGANQPRTVFAGRPLTVFFESDDRNGACFISFLLRHI